MYDTGHQILHLYIRNPAPGPRGEQKTITRRPDRPGPPAREGPYRRVLCAHFRNRSGGGLRASVRGFRAQWRSWLLCVSEFLRELRSQPNAAIYHDVHVVRIFQVLAQKPRGYLEDLLLRGVVERLAYGLISVLFYETEVRVCFSLLVLAQLCNRPLSAGKQHWRSHTVLANLRLVHRNVGPVGDGDRRHSEIPVGGIVHLAPLVRGRDIPKDTPATLPTLRVATTTRHANVLDFLVAIRQLDHVPEEVPAVVAQASFWLAL